MDKAKHEYQDLQKTIQQLSHRNTHEKSKFERFFLFLPLTLLSISFILSSSEYRKKCDLARTRLDALQQKTKQYRELMINLNGNSEKKYVQIPSNPHHQISF